MKNIDEILDEIREAAFQLEAQGAEYKKIIILAPKYFIDMLHDEFIGDKVNKEDKMTLFGYRVFPSFENRITVYEEDIVVDLGRLPIKIKLI